MKEAREASEASASRLRSSAATSTPYRRCTSRRSSVPVSESSPMPAPNSGRSGSAVRSSGRPASSASSSRSSPASPGRASPAPPAPRRSPLPPPAAGQPPSPASSALSTSPAAVSPPAPIASAAPAGPAASPASTARRNTARRWSASPADPPAGSASLARNPAAARASRNGTFRGVRTAGMASSRTPVRAAAPISQASSASMTPRPIARHDMASKVTVQPSGPASVTHVPTSPSSPNRSRNRTASTRAESPVAGRVRAAPPPRSAPRTRPRAGHGRPS